MTYYGIRDKTRVSPNPNPSGGSTWGVYTGLKHPKFKISPSQLKKCQK